MADDARRDPARRYGPSTGRSSTGRPSTGRSSTGRPERRVASDADPRRSHDEHGYRELARARDGRDAGLTRDGRERDGERDGDTRLRRRDLQALEPAVRERPDRPDGAARLRRPTPPPSSSPSARPARTPASGRPAGPPPHRPDGAGRWGPPGSWTGRIRAAGGGVPRPRHALRLVVTVLSVLVFAVSGTAWAALSGSVSTSSRALGGLGDQADGATDVLLVGTDSRTDAQGNPLSADVLRSLGAADTEGTLNTDTMMLVRIPNDGTRAVAFSIPRDSFVPIPGQFGRNKINSVYPGAKAQEATRLVEGGDTDARDVDVRSSEAGRQALVQAVAGLTGLDVDHYAEINLLGFYNLTTAVGGVDVCLKNAVDDDFSGAHFPAGPRSVSGHDALAFVRQRHGLPQGDLDRVRRQQAFLAGLSRKILSAGTLSNPVTLARLLDAVKQSVVLDGDWDLLGFAQQMQGVSGGSVAFMTIPNQGTQTTSSAGSVLMVDPVEVQRFVSDAIGEQRPPDADAPAPGSVPVDVRNASDTNGAAARVVSVLIAQGWTRSAAGNAENSTRTSTVLSGPAAEAGAAAVARTLGGLPTRPDPSVPPGTVRVLLAEDYKGPGASESASSGTGGSAATGRSASGLTAATAAPPPPPPPPITADGVACVN